MGMDRKVRRNVLKSYQGNNKINQAWANVQIDKYGIKGYLDMRKQNGSSVSIKEMYK